MSIAYGILEDLDLVVRTLREVFGPAYHDRLNADFVRWMRDAPWGRSRWFAAFKGGHGNPIGIYGLLPMVLQSGNEVMRGALTHNVGVVPEHRGRGVFTALGKYALGQVRPMVAVGVSNAAALPGHVKVGWNEASKLVVMSRDRIDQPLMTWIDDRTVDSMADSDSRTFVQPRGLRVMRTKDYLLWRLSKPGEHYESYFGRQVFIKRREGRSQVIATRSLTDACVIEGKVDVVCFEEQSELLREHGFEKTHEWSFIVREHDQARPPARWNRFEAIDFDVF